MFDSQAEVDGQMSGIIIGGGSKCDCYNNFISQGKGDGIEIHGLAGFKVFNNIIIDAGQSYKPTDISHMKYGIFITDVSAQQDSSFCILFNTILNPKSDGIRFISLKSKNNLIASNAIINPGTFDYYENGNTRFKGEDAYIMIPEQGSDVQRKNNYLARNSENAGFTADGYSLMAGSALINAAWSDTKNISFDFFHYTRPWGSAADIGAVEYNPSVASISEQAIVNQTIFPNPVSTQLNFEYKVEKDTEVYAGIYDLKGTLVIEKNQHSKSGEMQHLHMDVSKLPPGIYIYTLRSASQTVTGKFIKKD
jgi:hypothetical protein